jgi:hypothetical protein
MYGVEVTFNDMTSVLNFINIYQLVQKLLGGTDRQTDDPTSLTFLFKASSLGSSMIFYYTKLQLRTYNR